MVLRECLKTNFTLFVKVKSSTACIQSDPDFEFKNEILITLNLELIFHRGFSPTGRSNQLEKIIDLTDIRVNNARKHKDSFHLLELFQHSVHCK